MVTPAPTPKPISILSRTFFRSASYVTGADPGLPISASVVEFNKNPIGTGPFKFNTWSKGTELVLVKNEEYFEGEPKIEKVIFKTILEATGRKIAIEEGEIDVLVSGRLLTTMLEELENNPDIRVYKDIGSGIEYLGFNTFVPPLNDSRVREAISYAIDYDYIINNIMDGRASRLKSPIPEGII